MLRDPVTLGIAVGCVGCAVVLTIFQICQHLRNYTEPVLQRYIVRIIFMVPSYAVTSFLSLKYRNYSIYFDTPRDCYEAWVIYNFLALCMAYVGGPGAVVVKAEGKIVKPSWITMTCCFPPLPVDGFFLRRCKQGALQFVILKPILAAMTMILFALGLYEDGDWSPAGGYLYISLIYNICYTVALTALLMFYLGTDEILKPFKPLLKLILIKTVIFLTFWQGIGISMISSRFTDPTDAAALQDWIVCIEMLGSAIMMQFAFPHTEFKLGGTSTGWNMAAIWHALSIADVVSDAIHQFNPSYKTYVLYSDGGPADNVKQAKFRKANKGAQQGRKKLKEMQEGGAVPNSSGKRRSSLTGSTDDGDGIGDGVERDEEGQLFGKVQQDGFFKRAIRPAKALVGWVPGISETERQQAIMLDSESDVDDDDGAAESTQLDDTVLQDSGGSGSDRQRGAVRRREDPDIESGDAASGTGTGTGGMEAAGAPAIRRVASRRGHQPGGGGDKQKARFMIPGFNVGLPVLPVSGLDSDDDDRLMDGSELPDQ